MNIFRYCGDFAHLASFFILFYKIFTTKQVGGISLKTQELYVIVFCSRYIDLLWNFASLYNWCMKLLFIGSSVAIVFIMRRGHLHGRLVVAHDPESDCKWPIWWLLAPCAAMGVIWHEYSAEHRLFEIIWSFSIWLEAVAILPQVAVMQNEGSVRTSTHTT
jgi:ER lumen protein retaining receptor